MVGSAANHQANVGEFYSVWIMVTMKCNVNFHVLNYDGNLRCITIHVQQRSTDILPYPAYFSFTFHIISWWQGDGTSALM